MSSTWRPDCVGVVLEHLGPRRHARHVDVAADAALAAAGVLGPGVHHPAQVQLGVTHGAHLPVDDGGQPRRRPVLEHHVGELVVAVHDPRDVVERLVGAQPGRRLVEAGQLASFDALEEGGPAVHLALVEAVGPAEVFEPLGLPVDLGQQGDALHQLVGETLARLEVGVEGRGPHAALHAHGRPAVDEAHQVEGAAQHRRVRADGDGLGVRHVRPVQRLDDPPLADDAGVPLGRCGRRRDPHGGVQVAPAQLVDLVLAAPRDVAVLERRPGAEPFGVHPGHQPVHVGDGRCRVVGCSHRRSVPGRARSQIADPLLGCPGIIAPGRRMVPDGGPRREMRVGRGRSPAPLPHPDCRWVALGSRSEERHALTGRAEGEQPAVGGHQPVAVVGVVVEAGNHRLVEVDACRSSRRTGR